MAGLASGYGERRREGEGIKRGSKKSIRRTYYSDAPLACDTPAVSLLPPPLPLRAAAMLDNQLS